MIDGVANHSAQLYQTARASERRLVCINRKSLRMADESGDESELHWQKESWPWHDNGIAIPDGVRLSSLPATPRAHLCDSPPSRPNSTDSRRRFSIDGIPATPRSRCLFQGLKKDAASQKKYGMVSPRASLFLVLRKDLHLVFLCETVCTALAMERHLDV
jgi:hypothetical protein